DEQDAADRRRDERDEVRVLLTVADVREAVRERDGEQEREQHLAAGERDAELVQKLDQLAVEPLVLILVGHRPENTLAGCMTGRCSSPTSTPTRSRSSGRGSPARRPRGH